MNRSNKFRYIVGITSMMFAFAPLAHAMMLANEANVVQAVGDDSLKVETNDEVKTTAMPVTGVRMEGGVNTAGGIRTDSGEKQEVGGNNEDGGPGHATGTLRAEEEANIQAKVGLENAELHVGRSGGEDEGSEAAKTDIESAAQVRTSDDMKSFVSRRTGDDPRIEKVDVANGKVDVDYQEPAKLFGFINTSVTAHASADVNGNVEVKYPWYHIFMKKQTSSASLQSEIARAIAAEKKATKEGVATTTVQADVTAAFGIPDLFDIITKTLKSVSVEGSATAKVAQ